jgi:4-alpha-glucanotransferase
VFRVPPLNVGDVKFPRSSGILLHVTSLPSPFGIGDLGESAYEFADFLAAAGHKIWQVLPLNPTGFGDSPYQCFSAFAGNPLLIDLRTLREQGMLDAADLANVPSFPEDRVDYERVIEYKHAILYKAARNFSSDASHAQQNDFETFRRENAAWLNDFALFMTCKHQHREVMWTKWDAKFRHRDPEALATARQQLAPEIQACKFWQFLFFQQWQKLKWRCHELGIRIMGDIPIYVAHDSSDVWSHRELFQLDENGNPTVVAGVPPDYFSATGQLWGNPIYRWDLLAQGGYSWWIDRFRASLNLFDLVRIDHFRGFEAYWEIPAGSPTAASGRWVKGPGAQLFRMVQSALGELPIVAENLGVITPEVEAIRHEFGYPGMSLLQFAFGNDPQGPSFRPHNYGRELVAYTGGHDNDTTVGWWTSSGAKDSIRTPEDVRKEHAFAHTYLGFHEAPVNWVFIRAVLASVADTAVIPLQDALGLGSEARMNLPGTLSGNWRWRFKPGALTAQVSECLQAMNSMYDRC